MKIIKVLKMKIKNQINKKKKMIFLSFIKTKF